MDLTSNAPPRPRFRAAIWAYHKGRWQWAYDVIDTRPLDGGEPRAVGGRAQFASQPDALKGALATLANLP